MTLLVLVTLALVLPAYASAADPLGSVTFYKEGLRPGTVSAGPFPITSALGSDGNVWIVDNRLTSLSIPALIRVKPSGAITEYAMNADEAPSLKGLNVGSDLVAIATGPEGKLWITDKGTTPAIAVVDPTSPESAEEFSAKLNAGAVPQGIVAGPEGNLWFADASETTPAIGVIDPKTKEIIKECGIVANGGNAGSLPRGIAAGADGNLWFTDTSLTTPAIGRINPSTCEVKEFAIPGGTPGGTNNNLGGPWGIAAGADGNVWFTENSTERAVCRITPSGTVTCFKAGLAAGSHPFGLAAGPDGKLWFTDESAVKEEQEVVIEASESLGGTYKLSYKGNETGGEGTGNLLSAAKGKGTWKRYPTVASSNATCVRTPGSKILKECSNEPAVNAEVGMRIEGTGIQAETLITKVEGTSIYLSSIVTGTTGGSTTNVKAGRVLLSETTSGKFELGQTPLAGGVTGPIVSIVEEAGKVTAFAPNAVAATASGTAIEPSATTTTVVTGVKATKGAFSTGEQVTGTGIPAGTTISSLNTALNTLTLSAKPTEAGSKALSADLRFDTTGANVATALRLLPGVPASSFESNSTGATSPVKRVIKAGGAFLGSDIEQLTCNGAGLTGTSPSCNVTTITAPTPSAVGSVTTKGKISRYTNGTEGFTEVKSLVAGSDGNLWLPLSARGGAKIGKFGIECIEKCNLRTLIVTKSANGPGGTGTVSSKPKGIKCGATCSEAVASMYKSTPVELTAKPATGSAFVKWENAKEGGTCDGSTNAVCTVPMSEDTTLEAVFSGVSKTITPTEALTVSKGESTGKGTVKGPGLGCEAECTSTVVLFQGPITEPKFKAGKTVVLKQAPAFGSKFAGWSGCESEPEGNCQVTMETAKEVTANYTTLPNKVLTVNKEYAKGNGAVSSKPKGIKCGTTCTQAVAQMPEGAAVELTAKPSTGIFVKWVGGDCEGSTNPVCVVTMNTDETTKAVFSEPGKAFSPQETLTLNKAGSGYGTVKAAGLGCEVLCSSTQVIYQGPITEPKFKAGKTVILKATSAPGSKAVSWSGCDSVTEAGECVVAMETNKTITATFDELK
jgi:streptogramin lyase